MPIVSIPNVGDVEFPNEMSESDIAASIKSNLPNWQTHGASGSWANTTGEQVLGRLAKGAAGGIAGPLEAIGIAASGLAQKYGDPILGDSGGELADRPTYQAGQYLRRKTAEAFPVDESRPHSFLTDTLPEAAGSMGSFIVGGLAGKVAKASGAATVAALGAGSTGADAFNEAKKKGASDDDAFKVFAINAGLGTTEAVPIGGWLARLNKASGNKLTRAIREGSEEALQEVFQQYGSNLTAQKYYDLERPWHTGIIEGGAAGMTLGSLMSLVVSGIGGRRARLAGEEQNAINQRQQQESNQPKRIGAGEPIQAIWQDRGIQPIEPQSGAIPGSRDIAQQGEQVAQTEVSPPVISRDGLLRLLAEQSGSNMDAGKLYALGADYTAGGLSSIFGNDSRVPGLLTSTGLMVRTPEGFYRLNHDQFKDVIADLRRRGFIKSDPQVSQTEVGPTVTLAPTIEENLALLNVTPASPDNVIASAITQLQKTVQNNLDAGVAVPETLAAQFGVVEKPIAPINPQNTIPRNEVNPNEQTKKEEVQVFQVPVTGPLNAVPMTATAPTTVDSQQLIDHALTSGGGNDALRLVIPEIRIRYGPLSSGIPMQYEAGVVTINKPLLDMIAAEWPNQSPNYITHIFGEELVHAVGDKVIPPDEFVSIGQEMSETDRRKLLSDRPDIMAVVNSQQQLYQLGAEHFRRIIQRELTGSTTEEALPRIDPATTLGQRILSILQRIWDYLTSLVQRSKPTPVLDSALATVRQALDDLKAGRPIKPLDLGATDNMGPLNAEAIKDALALFKEDPTKSRELGIGQAGEIVAANPTAQQTLAGLKTQAATPNAPNTQQRFLSDVARKVLSRPFIRKNLVVQSEHLLASTTALHGDLETLERLEASGAPLEELSTAYSNAFETLQTFEQTQLDLNSAYARQLPRLVNRIAINFDAEVEALTGRDVYSVLFKDFQTMGRQLMRIQKDAAVLAAYKQAVGSKGATINVLKFIREHMDFTGMTRDDLHSVDDLINRIRNTIVNNTGKFRNWDGVDVAKVVGASEDVIRSVLRIVALSEPIRTDIEESKAVVEGRQYAGPISALKAKLAEEIKSGKYTNAFTLYERGIGTTAIELKASRDEANFYLRDTKRLLVNLQALVEAHEIAQKLASDPELIRQRNLVYKFARVQTITHTPNGTEITFLRADPKDEPIKLEFGNSQVSHARMVDLAVQLHSEYQAYIVTPDVPGFDPRLAAGMEKSLETLEYFTDPSQNPKVRARMLPGMLAKTFDWLSGKVGYAGLIPKYLTTGTVGHLADIEHIARSAYSVVVEKIGLIEAQHEDRLSTTLKAALKTHSNITPGQYELLVFNPLSSSRQNYNNPGLLKPGDHIGNGETVTVEDMAYLRAWRAYDNALHEMVENTGQIKFQSVKLMFSGILFDKNGKIRLPLAHGPDMTSRRFPSVLKLWTDTWFESSTDQRIAFLDFWKDPLIIGYIRGTREVDWKGSYSYLDEVRQIALEFNEPDINPIVNFDDLVNRVFELYNQKDGVEPKDVDTIQNDLLSDFNDIFVKVKPFSDQGAGNPKTSLEVVGGDNSFNTPRSALVMPPGWYKYGGVTKADRASSGRSATIAFQLAYQKALTALRDSLHSIVINYEERRKVVPEVGISEQRKITRELMSSGDLLYSLGESQRLLELVDNQLKHVKVMMDRSANPYVKDEVHMAMMRGGAQFVITSVVSGPAAVIKNVGGGFQNLLLFDRMMFRNNVFYNIANRSADLLGSGLRELVYAATHSGNPITGGLRKLLENTENVAFIGQVSKLVLGYANRLREDYNHATDIGVNYNINLWGTTKARWKYSKTLGQPTSSNPSQLEGVTNQLSLLGNTLAQYVGQMTVGYVDRGLNTKAIAAAVPLQKRFRDIAIEFGPYIEPSGLFPDKAISKGGWDTNTAAATIRDFFRRNGIGSIDGIMADFYRRYLSDKATETTTGELSSKTPLFTEDQFHQLQQIIAEDINLSTFSTRPTFAKQSSFHAKLSVLWGWPTWFITKLVHLLDGLSNKSWLKNVGLNLPTLVSLGLAIALTAPLIYGAAAFIKRLFENKVTGFPTVFDAQNPQQLGQAVMAATADSVPFFGSAFNMVTGAGYRTGFDLNSQFLALNFATDATKVFKEVAQTGDLGGPMQRFASRYFFPFNIIGSRLPGASGIREISNTKNILAMGARGTGLETKLRKPGSGPSGANYSPSTPILNAAMDAIGRGDMPAFQSAYAKLVEQKRAAGSLNAESSALTALKGRNPIVSVFGTKPTRDELEQVYRRVNPSLAARARKTINAFDSAIASVPRRTTTKARTATRRTGLLRRPRLRKPTLKMKFRKPRLRRQLV